MTPSNLRQKTQLASKKFIWTGSIAKMSNFFVEREKLSLETIFGPSGDLMTGRRPRNHFWGHTSTITARVVEFF